MIRSDFEQSDVDLSQLYEDLLQSDYMNSLTNTFMNQWNRLDPRGDLVTPQHNNISKGQ
jgi:hypothetical protein